MTPVDDTERTPRFTSPPPAPALRADARRNRERILRAAGELFAEQGLAAPLDEIAARAGVGPGTVYRHFPAKDVLFDAVVGVRVAGLVATARELATAVDTGAAFFGFLDRLFVEAGHKRDMSDALTLPGGQREELREAVATLLSRAQAAGAVRSDVGAEDLLRMVKGLIASVRGSTDPELPRRVFRVLGDGLRRPGPRCDPGR
jgi:AcrR family transcriptional regulator